MLQLCCVLCAGQVPEFWKRASYPSLRPLGSYLSDLYQRLNMLSAWAAAGKPPSVFWLPGFFFVQSFLTAGACIIYSSLLISMRCRLSQMVSYLVTGSCPQCKQAGLMLAFDCFTQVPG
jgi:hypothetical protein